MKFKSAFASTLFTLVFVGFNPSVTLAENAKQKRMSASVALVFDLSGAREAATDVIKGVEIATQELATQGLDLKLIKYDSRGTAVDVRKAMEKALHGQHDFIIAEVDSSKAYIAGEVAENAKRVMLTPYATSPRVTEGRKYVFRACFDDNFQGLKLAQFAFSNLNSKTAAIVSDAGELYSQALANRFMESFEKSGGKILFNEKILSDSGRIEEVFESALKLQPNVVFLPVYETFAARVVGAAIKKQDQGINFLGGDGWGSSNPFRDLVFSKGKETNAYWVTHFSDTKWSPKVDRVKKQFVNQFGRGFGGSVAIGYDSAMLAAEAIKSTYPNLTQERLMDALVKMPPYDGLTGKIVFNGERSPQKTLFINKIGIGKAKDVIELRP
jgi:branched-chain amino acid transport system substrate-binding protein